MTTLRVVPLRYQEPDDSGWTDAKEECELENAEFIGVFLQNRQGMSFLQDFPTVREARRYAFHLARDFGANVEDVCTAPLRVHGLNEDQIQAIVDGIYSMFTMIGLGHTAKEANQNLAHTIQHIITSPVTEPLCPVCNQHPVTPGTAICSSCFYREQASDFPDDTIPSLADLDRYDTDSEPRGALNAEFPEDDFQPDDPDELHPEPEGGYSDHEDVSYFYMGDEL